MVNDWILCDLYTLLKELHSNLLWFFIRISRIFHNFTKRKIRWPVDLNMGVACDVSICKQNTHTNTQIKAYLYVVNLLICIDGFVKKDQIILYYSNLREKKKSTKIIVATLALPKDRPIYSHFLSKHSLYLRNWHGTYWLFVLSQLYCKIRECILFFTWLTEKWSDEIK